MPRGGLIKFEKTRRRSPVTAKHVAFLKAYWYEGLNATDAYLKTIARNPETLSRECAKAAACAILSNKDVREYLRDMQEYSFQSAGITEDRLLATAAAILFADRTKMFNNDGSIKPPHEWPRDLQIACDGIEIEEREGWIIDESGEKVRGVVGRKIKVRTGGAKVEVLKLLMKYKKMIDRNDTLEERQSKAAAVHPPILVDLEDDMPPVPQHPPQPGE